MTQAPFVGAPQGAVWGYDATTKLWLPIGASPEVIAASGEEYASLLVWVSNANPLGQQLSVGSVSVVPASDAPNFPTLLKNAGWTSIYTTTQTGVSAWAGSGDLDVHLYSQLMITCNLTAITGTSIQFKWARKDSFGNLPSLWLPSARTTTGTDLTSVGPGLSVNHVLGSTGQLNVTMVAITSVSFTVDVQGR